MNQLLTVKEAAEILKLNPCTIYKLVEAGELAHVRIGKRTIRIPEETLLTYGTPQKPEPPSPSTRHVVTKIV